MGFELASLTCMQIELHLVDSNVVELLQAEGKLPAAILENSHRFSRIQFTRALRNLRNLDNVYFAITTPRRHEIGTAQGHHST